MTIRMIAGLLSLSMAVSCMMSEDYNAFYDGEFYPSEAGDEGYDDGGDSFDEIRENPFVKTRKMTNPHSRWTPTGQPTAI